MILSNELAWVFDTSAFLILALNAKYEAAKNLAV